MLFFIYTLNYFISFFSCHSSKLCTVPDAICTENIGRITRTAGGTATLFIVRVVKKIVLILIILTEPGHKDPSASWLEASK